MYIDIVSIFNLIKVLIKQELPDIINSKLPTLTTQKKTA